MPSDERQPHPHHLRDAVRIGTVRLVDLCLQHRLFRNDALAAQAKLAPDPVGARYQGGAF